MFLKCQVCLGYLGSVTRTGKELMCYTPILEEFQFFLVVPLPFSHIAVHVLPGKTSQLLAESNIDILIWPIKIDILIISESNIDILIISEPNIDILIISDKANILTNCL